MANIPQVPHFPDLEIDIDDRSSLVKKSKNLVAKLRPDWNADLLREKIFSDGITNVLVGIFQDGCKDDMVLVRLYGHHTEEIIDRQAEIENICLLRSFGCGAELYATFKTGMAYSYIPGEIPTSEMIIQPKVNQLVIEMFAKMHRMKSGGQACLWDRMRKFLALCPDGFPDDAAKEARLQQCCIMSRQQMSLEVDEMERELRDCGSPVVFCHNDLLLGNIVYDEARKSVTFIDFEYGDMNYQALDIGNHFSEFVGLSDDMDYDRWYPKENFQKDWIGRYLRAFHDREATDQEVHKTYVLVNKFSLCANLCWGIWALVQAKNSTLDFDFITYSMQRLNEYKRRKSQFLALK